MRSMKHAKKAPARRREDEQWSRDIAILRQAAQELAQRRSARPGRPRIANSPFEQIAELLDDPSPEVRQKAVRNLYEMDPDQAATDSRVVNLREMVRTKPTGRWSITRATPGS